MSCFESSTFLKNPQVFSQPVLIKAIKKLDWEYKMENNQLIVTQIPGQELHGEYAIKVDGERATYNSYYLNNGQELVKELQSEFFKLNVEYSKDTIISEFQSRGFSLKKDYDFVPNEKEIHRFYMVGYSKDKFETERKSEILFTILNDGTVISDSNYIPKDLHDLADLAMEGIENKFGRKRREGIEIKRKEIPAKYRDKAYCSVNNKIKSKN